MSFTSEPAQAPLEITGSVTAELYASSDAPDTDFTAKLVDVAPDGSAMSITDGILRARYRHGPEAVLLTPGEVECFRIHVGWDVRVARQRIVASRSRPSFVEVSVIR